jgi:hypothetical protein
LRWINATPNPKSFRTKDGDRHQAPPPNRSLGQQAPDRRGD